MFWVADSVVVRLLESWQSSRGAFNGSVLRWIGGRRSTPLFLILQEVLRKRDVESTEPAWNKKKE